MKELEEYKQKVVQAE